MATDAEEPSDGELNLRAADGDTQAAALYLRRQLPFLRSMARRVAPSGMDADDLLGDALLRLTQKWHEGTGPRTFAHTYVISTMRNLVVDETRSGRARTEAVPDELFDELPETHTSPQIRAVDAHDEFALVRQALLTLPEDQRDALVGVITHGLKPAEVAASLGRPASAVSSLLHRGKANLRRAILVTLLARGDEDCRANSDQIPRVPRDEPASHDPSERGIAHVLTCEECSKRWARWAKMGTALGITPLLVLAEVSRPKAASASDTTDSRAYEARPRNTQQPSTPDREPHNANLTRNARSNSPSAQLHPATEARELSGPRSTHHEASATSAAAGQTGDTSGGSAPRRAWTWVRTHRALGAAIAVCLLGAGLGVAALVIGFGGSQPQASLNVSPANGDSLSIRFSVNSDSWATKSLTVHVAGAIIRTTPTAWGCSLNTAATEATCMPGPGPVQGTVTVDNEATSDSVDYVVDVTAQAGSYTVSGTSDGSFSAAE